MVILAADTTKQTEMKEKVFKRVPQNNNFPKPGQFPCKILWTILKSNDEFKQIGQRTSKSIPMHKVLFTRDDMD